MGTAGVAGGALVIPLVVSVTLGVVGFSAVGPVAGKFLSLLTLH